MSPVVLPEIEVSHHFFVAGPSVPAFQTQVLKIIQPQEKLILASTHIKDGTVFNGPASTADGASVASGVTFDTFDDSFASYKDLNKSFMRGAELENSIYDASVKSPDKTTLNKKTK